MHVANLLSAFLSLVYFLPVQVYAVPVKGQSKDYDEEFFKVARTVIERHAPKLQILADKYTMWDKAKKDYAPRKPVLSSADIYLDDQNEMRNSVIQVVHYSNRLQNVIMHYEADIPFGQRSEDNQNPVAIEMRRVAKLASSVIDPLDTWFGTPEQVDTYLSEKTFTNELESQVKKGRLDYWKQKLSLDASTFKWEGENKWDNKMRMELEDRLPYNDFKTRKAVNQKRIEVLQKHQSSA